MSAQLIAPLDWPALTTTLLDEGHVHIPGQLPDEACDQLIQRWDDEGRYRSHIHMARHNFGRGEYKYFAYSLPNTIQLLRERLYQPLAGAANLWAERLGHDQRYPLDHADYVAACHTGGQTRPTPLILRYGAGDYNCLHQDLYGDLWFPYQVAFLLSEPGADFDGGEFVLVENRPRMQSKASVIPLRKGDAVIFAVNQRPRRGARGYHRAVMRHGVSEVRRGSRFTLGIIFHDAK